MNSSVNKKAAEDAQDPAAPQPRLVTGGCTVPLLGMPSLLAPPGQLPHWHPCHPLPQAWLGRFRGSSDTRGSCCQLLKCENRGNLSAPTGRFRRLFLKMAVNRLFFTPSPSAPALSGGNCIAIHCPVTKVISPVQTNNYGLEEPKNKR